MQSLLRPKLLLGTTPYSANSAGSSRGFRLQAKSPRRGLGADLKSFGQNQGIAWSSDSSLWGNQVQKENNKSFGQNQGIAWSSDSSLWGNQVQKEILTSSGQNQGLAWSSDPSLWGNQLLKRRNWVTWILLFCPRILNTKGASTEWRNAFPKSATEVMQRSGNPLDELFKDLSSPCNIPVLTTKRATATQVSFLNSTYYQSLLCPVI